MIRPLLFGLIGVSLMAGLVIGLVRLLHREWWRIARVRQVLRLLWGLGILGVLAWALSVAAELPQLKTAGVSLLSGVLVGLLMLLVSLPFSGGLAALVRLARKLVSRGLVPGGLVPGRPDRELPDGPANPSRRDLLLHATAIVPGAALAAGGAGLVGALADPSIDHVRIVIPRLAAELEGVRMLQLTDIHLGTFVGLAELERFLEGALALRPDLVLMTGDTCDRLELLPDALRMIEGLRPRLGTFASLGNHEYYRGLVETRRAFDRSGIPLLVDRAVRVPVGAASLLIAGVDDPAIMGRAMEDFLERSVTRCLSERRQDDLAVMLSHRPDGFDAAARHGAEVTLSGHTHGGQIGIGGRSAFESFFPGWYLRGLYRRGRSTLYTSAGFGHWFPFRLACPAQAPLLILSGTAAT